MDPGTAVERVRFDLSDLRPKLELRDRGAVFERPRADDLRRIGDRDGREGAAP